MRVVIDRLGHLGDGVAETDAGPVFASGSHGYDTIDYRRIDPRLGDDADFDALLAACRERGLRILLDGVFNHVGTDFPLFRQAVADGPGSEAAGAFRFHDQPGYQVDGLGTMGEVTAASTVKVVSKLGRAANMRSRADKSHVLVGTKEWCVRRGSTYIGRGRKDQCPIMIVPSAPRGQVERLALLHLDLHEQLSLDHKVSLLRDLSGRYEDVKSQVLETDAEWTDAVLESISAADLILLPVEQLTERVLAYFAKGQEVRA